MRLFADYDLEGSIRSRARAFEITLTEGACRGLADHARQVAGANARLHLTGIQDPEEYLDRHLGEAFAGASLLAEEVEGVLVDLGSGNGYPGLAVAAARPGLSPILVEASQRKAEFLERVVQRIAPSLGLRRAGVLRRQVQRPADLDDPATGEPLECIAVLTVRAVGHWEKIVPRLWSALAPDGAVLLWVGESATRVLARAAWERFREEGRVEIPGRERTAVRRLKRR